MMASVSIEGQMTHTPVTVNCGVYTPTERLCIFCAHFRWQAEEMWGTGSTMTGPMFCGGDSTCGKGHYKGKDLPTRPDDEDDFRTIILQAINCPDYLPPK